MSAALAVLPRQHSRSILVHQFRLVVWWTRWCGRPVYHPAIHPHKYRRQRRVLRIRRTASRQLQALAAAPPAPEQFSDVQQWFEALSTWYDDCHCYALQLVSGRDVS